MRNRRLSLSGFSLVELCFVLVLMGIAAGIAVPRYASSLANYRVGFAARKVGADIAMAQSVARAQSQGRTVTFATSTSSYQIAPTSGNIVAGNSGTIVVSLAASPFQASITAVSFAGANQITFDGFGTPSSGGTVTLSSGGASKTVVVDATTGACTIP